MPRASPTSAWVKPSMMRLCLRSLANCSSSSEVGASWQGQRETERGQLAPGAAKCRGQRGTGLGTGEGSAEPLAAPAPTTLWEMGWVAEGFSPTPEQGALLRDPKVPPPHPAPRRTSWTPRRPRHSAQLTPRWCGRGPGWHKDPGTESGSREHPEVPLCPNTPWECRLWPQAQTRGLTRGSTDGRIC